MASDVKWIKVATDIFDDEKIKLIEAEPEADKIIICWFKLLCLAGKQNNSGVFTIGKKAFTAKMLATVFRMKEDEVQLAIETFQNFGMVETIDGVITIPNWGKHQSLDALEKKRERDKVYQESRRAKQKEKAELSDRLSDDCKTIKSSDIVTIEEEREIEEEVDKYNYKSVLSFLNETCKTRFRLTEKTRRTIHARFEEGFTLEDFQTVIQKKFNEWNGTEFEKYLRPETLFGTKFERYLLEEVKHNGCKNETDTSETGIYGDYF